jgi:hypothetical protein
MQFMAVKKAYLKVLFIIALSVGLAGIILSALFASYAFIIFSLPNLSLGAFFGYKYYTHDKNIEGYEQRKKKRSRNRH